MSEHFTWAANFQQFLNHPILGYQILTHTHAPAEYLIAFRAQTQTVQNFPEILGVQYTHGHTQCGQSSAYIFIIWIYTHIWCMYTYIYVYLCIYIYIYIYMYIGGSKVRIVNSGWPWLTRTESVLVCVEEWCTLTSTGDYNVCSLSWDDSHQDIEVAWSARS